MKALWAKSNIWIRHRPAQHTEPHVQRHWQTVNTEQQNPLINVSAPVPWNKHLYTMTLGVS